MNRRLFGLVLVAGFVAPACEQDEVTAGFDTDTLVECLRGAGTTVERRGTVSQPFFTVTGTSLSVNGETVQAFEYRDAAAAEAEARLVSADGSSIGATAVNWVAAPHFHRRERVIALHVGEAAAVKAALATVMGPQFAGR